MTKFEKRSAAPLLAELEELMRAGAPEDTIMQVRSELCKCEPTGAELKVLHALTSISQEVKHKTATITQPKHSRPPLTRRIQSAKKQPKQAVPETHTDHMKFDKGIVGATGYLLQKLDNVLAKAEIHLLEREREALEATAQKVLGYELKPKRQLKSVEVLMDAACTKAINPDAVWQFVELLVDEDLLTREQLSRAYIKTIDPSVRVRNEMIEKILGVETRKK